MVPSSDIVGQYNMVTLTDLFKAHQDQMKAFLNKKMLHAVEQGDNSENAWLEFFSKYLPARYRCDKGHVIDSKGQCSEQIDLIVYDNYFSPFLLNDKNTKYIPAESVYAVFESKPELSKATFNYAQQKIASVRKLYRTSAPVIANGRECPGREPFKIIGGLLAINNKWKKTLEKQPVNLNADNFLDMGCCINDKSWVAQKDPLTEKFKYIFNACKDETLLSFFMTFLYKLQQRGSVPAMEIPKYFDGFSR